MSDINKNPSEEEKHESNEEDNGYIKFLLEEYRYFSDWFKRSEETGEKRLNFYITLVTAIIAVIMTFITSTTEFPEILSTYTPIIISLLLSLLVLGILTFGRIIKRNKVSDGYKKDIDHIRSFFKVKYKEELQDYEFFHEIKGRKILTGGVADVIISMNSILFAITVLFLTFTFTLLLRILLFILSFFGIFIISQYIALIQYYKNYIDLMNINKPTKLLLKKYIIIFSLSGVFLVLIMLFIILWFFYYITSNLAIFFEFSAIILICICSIIWIIGFWNLRKRYYRLTKRVKTSRMRWEWRIFFRENDFDLWKHLAEDSQECKSIINNESVSKFHDYYINLENADYGLKERWILKNGAFLPYIELKVRSKVDSKIKTELWEKIISNEIKNSINEEEGLNKNQLLDFLQKCLYDSSLENSNNIEKVVSHLNKLGLERIYFNKERKQIRGKFNKKLNKWEFLYGHDRQRAPLENANVILIEQTNIIGLQIGNQVLSKLRTICLETKENVKIIKKFIDNFIKFSGYHLMSYPKFIENPDIIK